MYDNTSQNCCCIEGIRAALMAIKESVHCFAPTNPGFGVTVTLTLVTSTQVNLYFGTGVPDTIKICEKVIIADGNTISLCDIAKISISLSGTNYDSFRKYLISKLCSIAKNNPRCDCNRNYFAIDIDDEDVRRPRSSRPNYPSQKTCKYCGKKCGDTCNCRKPTECSSCRRPIEDCCCKDAVEHSLNCNKNDITSVDYKGESQVINTICVPTDIDYVTVVNTVNLTTTYDTVLTNAQVNTQTYPGVQSISTVNTAVVNNITTLPLSIVNGYTTVPQSVVGSFTSSTVPVVSSIATGTQNLVTNVTATTSSISYPGAVTNVSVVTSLNTENINLVTGINTTTIVVPVTLSYSTTTVSAGVFDYGTLAVAEISSSTLSVLTGINPHTVPVVTGYNNPTLTTVITGVTSVSTIAAVAQTVPVLSVDATGPLYISIPIGLFGSVLDANSVAISLPSVLTTLPLYLGNTIVTIAAIQNIFALPSAATLLNVGGTPSLTTVIKSLGTPSIIPAITSIDSYPATAVASIVPKSSRYIYAIDNNPIQAVNAITTPTLVLLNNVTANTLPITVVDSYNSDTLQKLSNFTTVVISGALNVASIPVTIVNSITPGSVTNVSNVVPVTVVKDVVPTTTTINVLNTISTTLVTQQVNPTTLSFVTAAWGSTVGKQVVSSASLPQTQVSVVEEIYSDTVVITTPAPETIDGIVNCVGNGIMVVTDASGDVIVYSTCQINSFTTN